MRRRTTQTLSRYKTPERPNAAAASTMSSSAAKKMLCLFLAVLAVALLSPDDSYITTAGVGNGGDTL